MPKKKYPQPEKPDEQKSDEDQDRRTTERRKSKCDGYTYIPMVGWYCRREESRRGDDDLK
ncbi:MAG: hypothetical protein ACD_75C01476G0002 [uncultured bacterium]|nr:MAG: hypothetical protein ACD_75C01476G0002 [uncultured bacterium]